MPEYIERGELVKEYWDAVYDGELATPYDVDCFLRSFPAADLGPCDVCVYGPPSSLDGKPCCMCPASGAGKDGKRRKETTA